jgi:hypothetical protein
VISRYRFSRQLSSLGADLRRCGDNPFIAQLRITCYCMVFHGMRFAPLNSSRLFPSPVLSCRVVNAILILRNDLHLLFQLTDQFIDLDERPDDRDRLLDLTNRISANDNCFSPPIPGTSHTLVVENPLAYHLKLAYSREFFGV